MDTVYNGNRQQNLVLRTEEKIQHTEKMLYSGYNKRWKSLNRA